MSDENKQADGHFELNKPYNLGTLTLSEQDIIDYARANDPLEFHLDKKAAEQSIFKGLVASGSQVFNVMYKTRWLPMFGHSVICGLGVDSWKFIRPVYANQPVTGTVTPVFIKENKEKKHTVVTWYYEFKDSGGQLFQTLDVTVLHKI